MTPPLHTVAAGRLPPGWKSLSIDAALQLDLLVTTCAQCGTCRPLVGHGDLVARAEARRKTVAEFEAAELCTCSGRGQLTVHSLLHPDTPIPVAKAA